MIVLGFVLAHVDNPSELITRYKKFLAPTGTMFVAVPSAESLLKTFDVAYRRAPEFPHVFPLIESVCTRHTTRIVDLAVASLRNVAHFCDRHAVIETSTVYGNGQLKSET